MAVMRSTYSSRQRSVVPSYKSVPKKAARTSSNKTFSSSLIKRTTPSKTTTAAKAINKPVVSSEAKFAAANTVFKSAISNFSKVLSSISGSYSSEYQEALKEAINAINATVAVIDATVAVAKAPLPPLTQASPPVNSNTSTTPLEPDSSGAGIQENSPGPVFVEKDAENQPDTAHDPVSEAATEVAQSVAFPPPEEFEGPVQEPVQFFEEAVIPMADLPDEEQRIESLLDQYITAGVEGLPANIEEALAQDSTPVERDTGASAINAIPNQDAAEVKAPHPYNISSYLVFQKSDQSEISTEDIRQQLRVVV